MKICNDFNAVLARIELAPLPSEGSIRVRTVSVYNDFTGM